MGKQTENIKKVHMFLTTLSKIFNSNTFDIHRDTIAEILSIRNCTVSLCMNSLEWKHKLIKFRITNEREYTVTMIECSEDICDDVMKYSKEDIKEMDETSLYNYKYMLEGQKIREAEAQHESLKVFLEEKKKEQIDNANKKEMLLKEVFDMFEIDYEYQHTETILKKNEYEWKGYIYDFLVDIDGKKYDVEVDGSSHNDREEQDKERDDLSKSIGIEPRRLPTQMIYEIEYEVRRGLLSKSDLLLLIVNNFTSIKWLWYAVTHWYNKFNEFEPELNILLKKLSEVELSIRNDTEEKKRFIVEFESNIKKAKEIVEFEISKRNEKIKELEDEISKRNDTIKNLEEKIKNEDEISSLFDAKERQREVRDEMARECFLLSKKNVGKVS